jgi:DNA modification methylase
VAVVEKVFETGPEQINHENVVQAFLAKIIDIWDSRWTNTVSIKSLREKNIGLRAQTHRSRFPIGKLHVFVGYPEIGSL